MVGSTLLVLLSLTAAAPSAIFIDRVEAGLAASPSAQVIAFPVTNVRGGFGFSSYASARMFRSFSLRLDVGGGRFSGGPGESTTFTDLTRLSGAVPVLFTPDLGPLTLRLGAGPAFSMWTVRSDRTTGSGVELGVQAVAGVSIGFTDGAAVFLEARSDAMTFYTAPALLLYPTLMCGLSGALSL